MGQCPDELKIAKIIPIFKSEDKLLINNYCPISILLLYSKILEGLMYNRLLKYLTLNKILVENQFGFRQQHSTYMALLKLVNDITEELDKGNCSIEIFIDLSKAFDTVYHKLLLRKMEHCSIRGNAVLWFTIYLSYRTQYVSLNHTNSENLPVTCGILQGSILGPLLFILFINDIVNASKIAEIIMFADNTTLFFKHKELSVLYTTINVELAKISQWFKLSKLSLNIKNQPHCLSK